MNHENTSFMFSNEFKLAHLINRFPFFFIPEETNEC